MKKQIITQNEYQEILQKLETIQLKKEYLNQIKKEYLQNNFNPYIEPISKLNLSLNRENYQLTQQINLEKKKFLSSFTPNKILYEKAKNYLDTFLIYLIHSYQISDLIQTQTSIEISFLKQLPNFQEFQTTIKTLIQKQEENLQLIQEINSLLKEQEQLLIQKKNFEKSLSKKRKSLKYF